MVNRKNVEHRRDLSTFHRKLLQCIQSGSNHEARELLQKIDDIHATIGITGKTLLHYSVNYGNEEMVRYFIERGCSLDARDIFGCTPLIIAVRNKNVAITEILLKNNTNIYDVDPSGMSTLHFAFTYWMHSSVELPKENQSLIMRMMFEKVDRDFLMDKPAITKLLLNADTMVKLSAIALANLELATILLDNGYPIDSCNSTTEMTALHCAIIFTKFQNTKLLIERGANVDALDKEDHSPMFYYIINDFEGIDTNLEVLRLWLRHSTHPNLHVDGRMSVVDYLLACGKKETVMAVLQSAIDMENFSMPPLYALMPNRNVDLIEIIKFVDSSGMKFNLNAYGPKNMTILMTAAKWCHEGLDIVEFLLKRGVDVNFTTRFESSALQMAAEGCFTIADQEMIALLLLHGANPQHILSNGMTLIDFVDSIRHGRKRCSIGPIVAHVAMLETTGKSSVSEVMRNSINAYSAYKKHFSSCLQQLEELKGVVVYGTVTLFKLLNESNDKIVAYARNPELIEAFDQAIRDMPRVDPYYFNILQRKVAKAVERTKLEEKVFPIIQKLTGYRIDVHPTIVYQMVHYLNSDDIENLYQV